MWNYHFQKPAPRGPGAETEDDQQIRSDRDPPIRRAFFAWEYGTARAVKKMSEVRNSFGALQHFRTRREAKQFQERVIMVVTWQRGRLGMTMNDGGIFLLDHPYRPLTEG